MRNFLRHRRIKVTIELEDDFLNDAPTNPDSYDVKNTWKPLSESKDLFDISMHSAIIESLEILIDDKKGKLTTSIGLYVNNMWVKTK